MLNKGKVQILTEYSNNQKIINATMLKALYINKCRNFYSFIKPFVTKNNIKCFELSFSIYTCRFETKKVTKNSKFSTLSKLSKKSFILNF